MKAENQKLLSALTMQVDQIIAFTHNNVHPLSRDELHQRPAENSWSVAECLEHMCLYGDYYLPAIRKQIQDSPDYSGSYVYNSGWLGNYFAKSMLPKEGVVKNKMKTTKDKNPIHLDVPENVVERFLNQQKELISLIENAKKVHIGKIRVPISITPFIKLKMGDTFRFFINHNHRHIWQIERILQDNPSVKVL